MNMNSKINQRETLTGLPILLRTSRFRFDVAEGGI